MILAIIIFFIYFELLFVGIAILEKKLNNKNYYLALIPIYGFRHLGKVSGTYKVLNVPVRNCFGFFLETIVVMFCCLGYWIWGKYNLVPKAYDMQTQIIYVPLIVCILLMYLGVIKASFKIFDRYCVKHYLLDCLLALFLIPIPIIMIMYRNETPISLDKMYI